MKMLRLAWANGLEPFLYDGKLQARRKNGPLTDADKNFLQENKDWLIFELKDLTYGPRVCFDRFIEDRRCNP